jgi:exopolyphosphatase/guanosine-5'-triphosphate,3'-diphosphate pyrophosphatase
MRLGVLDVGSNTVHLLVVDAHPGAHPDPVGSHKTELRLSELLGPDGTLGERGRGLLVAAVADAVRQAQDQGLDDLVAFATSAVREAADGAIALEQVRAETGVELVVLPGELEAAMTFLAVRRWFGWSAGRLGVFDIGGGSLEIAVGADEEPEVARSMPLGAGRLTREWLSAEPGRDRGHVELRLHARSVIADVAGPLLRGGGFDRAVATSKTFRSLARMCGAAPSSDGRYVRRVLRRADLRPLISEIVHLSDEEVAAMPGVSHDRAHQMVAGAVVAEAAMDLFGVEELEICPWALREGVLLEHLAHL